MKMKHANVLLRRARTYIREHQRQTKWRRLATGLACAAVFCTTYALILPAITLDQGQTLECSYTVHTHEDGCYDGDGDLICGYADFVVHTHQKDFCYDDDGELVCPLDEVEVHEHGDDCYEEQRILVCGQAEGPEGHTHETDCYEEQPVLICEEAESEGHVHTEDCYTSVQGELKCEETESAGHQHSGDCYVQVIGDLICEEDHEHTAGCFDQTEELDCGLEVGEGGHTHTDDCYAWTEELDCGMEEGAGAHTHGEACYGTEDVLVCQLEESESAHQHSEDCYEIRTVLTCEEPEVILHTHDEGCYEDILDEDDEVIGQTLVCPLLQVEEHQHDEACVTASNAGIMPVAAAGQWTAYDNEEEDDASTKFTVTLPEGTIFCDSDGDEIEESTQVTLKAEQYTNSTVGFSFAEHRKYINEHMSWHTGVNFPDESGASTNDAQFWRVYFEDAAGNEVDVRLPENGRATVVVEYLDSTNALKGDLGTRRTCVMDMGDPSIGVPEEQFVATDDYSLAVSYETADVDKTDTYYKKLTYYIDADADGVSAWGNLTALCSMKLPAGYMQSLSIFKIADGSAPFDAEEEDGTDQPGNDSADDNKIVRTFDSVVYTLQVVSASRSTLGQMTDYVAVVEAELDLDITQARFDATSLSSIFSGDDPWQIEYKDEDGNNLYIETASGIFKCDSDGKITSTKVTVNEIANGSDANDPYRTGIASQRLVAYRKMTGTGSSPAVPSTQTVTVQVNVLAAANGDEIQPDFTAYVKGNKDNFTSEQDNNNNYVVSAPSDDNQATPEEVTVSAAARYNIVLKKNADSSYSSYFNFTTGEETTSSDPNGVYGRNLSYGITLQLFNETNVTKADGSVDGSVLAEKGLRGVELPVGGITFEVAMNGNAGTSDSEDDYSAILWDYYLNYENHTKGYWERNMFWKGQTASLFPKGASVYSSGSRTNSAYNSGTWSLTASGAGVDTDGKTTGDITNTGSGVTYTFTVSGYDFDFDNFTFPSQTCGNAGDADWLQPGYIGAFAGGQIQVVQKYPDNVSADASPEITVEVKNLSVTSQSGTTTTVEAKEVTDEIGGTVDNKHTSNTVVYTPGGISKHNSFGSRTNANGNASHGSISINFLGTSYWDGPHYDAYAEAGAEIYLWGAAQLSRSSDAVVSAYNLLQKFDSKVLSIDTSVSPSVRYTEGNNDSNWPAEGWPNNKEGTLLEAAGEATFLYAADPKYPGGWDSNDTAQMARMNSATEEDLIYFTSLDDLESAGFTCCAILLEVRNAAIPAGCYPGMRVAMKVTEDTDYIGKTIATVNTARMWVKGPASDADILSDVSWENGSMNNLTAATASQFTTNQILDKDGEDVYSNYWDHDSISSTKVRQNLRDAYPGEATVSYISHTTYNNTNYHKTEYENGNKVDGTHEGYQQGMSLLVIGYESSVGIKVENTRNGESSDSVTGNVSFEAQYSEWTPLYTITGISTTATNPAGPSAEAYLTNLTITANVANDTTKDLLKMGASAFTVESLVKGEDDEWTEEWITVSEDEDQPTSVTFTGKDGTTYTYTIWAERIGEYEAVFHLSGVPVGEDLPDIQFEGQLGADIEHLANYTAQVTIQGDGDTRALSSGNRNIASVSITTVVLAGTTLTKTVSDTLIEQDGGFIYHITYTNTADEAMTQRLYLYDLMPYNGDIRSSDYERTEIDGEGNYTDASETLRVLEVGATLSMGNGTAVIDDGTVVRQYYSTIPGYALRPYLDFGSAGTSTSSEDIDALLAYALLGNDANGLYYVVKADDTTHTPVSVYIYNEDNIVTGINTDFANNYYKSTDQYGEVTLPDGYAFYNVTSGNLVTKDNLYVTDSTSGSTGGTIKLQCYKVFRWLGSIDGSGSLSAGNGTASSHLDNATCLYSVVENLGANTSLTISAKLETGKNEGGNVYGNIAHSWKEGDPRNGANLTSNLVTTRVVGRAISGQVWYDADLDGMRDNTEEPISGVTATLFKLNTQTGLYEQVKGGDGPNGRSIKVTYQGATEEVTEEVEAGDTVQLTTGADGSYQFSNLAAGQYVVAFSGTALDKYTGATTYQVNNRNDSSTNDGVALADTSHGMDTAVTISGLDGDYKYAIAYSLTDAVADPMTLHTLDQYKANISLLTNAQENIDHQDLGLVITGPRLPETGGAGTALFTLSGLALMGGALWLLMKRRGGTVCR